MPVDGALDPGEVFFEYITQHDGRVRPAHAALHGTVWKLGDPLAPVPPLDFGCRCSLSYRARPGSAAAKIIPEAPSLPTTRRVAFSSYLDKQAPGWEKVADAVVKIPPSERLERAVLLFRSAYPDLAASARDYALMIIDIGNSP